MNAADHITAAAANAAHLHDPLDRMAHTIGSLQASIRELCAKLSEPVCIANAIGAVPCTQQNLSLMVCAVAALVECAENEGGWDGLDTVCDHLQEATDAMGHVEPAIYISEPPERNRYDDSRDFAEAA
jgi:hypothetical protein